MRKILVLAIVLFTSHAIAAQPDITKLCGIPSERQANTRWCQCFHKIMVQQCLAQDGDELICEDANLRKILQPKINAFLQYSKQHKLANNPNNPAYLMTFYFKRCPLVRTTEKQSNQYSIVNMNDTTKPVLKRHVLLIGLDGVRTDAFLKVYKQLKQSHKIPFFTKLVDKAGIDTQFFAGGVKQTSTAQATTSEPGWTTILTGVWANQHHIQKNGDIAAGKYNRSVPTMHNIIHRAYPSAITASFTDWKPAATIASYKLHGDDNADINYFYQAKSYQALAVALQQMTNDIARAIKVNPAPNFIFTHYVLSDDSGHINRFNANSQPYLNTIKTEIIEANQLIKAVANSKKNWLVIVTTDHGGHGYSHGAQVASDRNIFAVVGRINGKHFSKYKKIDSKLKHGQSAFTRIIKDYLAIRG